MGRTTKHAVPPRTHPGDRDEGNKGPAPTQHTTGRHVGDQCRQFLDPLLQRK